AIAIYIATMTMPSISSFSDLQYGTTPEASRMRDSPNIVVIHGLEGSGVLWVARLLEVMGLEVTTGDGAWIDQARPARADTTMKPAFIATRHSSADSRVERDGASGSTDNIAHIFVFRPPWDLEVPVKRWIKHVAGLLNMADSRDAPWLVIEGTALASDP